METTFLTQGLDKSKPIIWDTETIGLYGRTRLIQVRQNDVHYEYDCFLHNIEDIKYWFKDCHLVMHNAHYDLSCEDFRRWLPRKLDDTMMLARLQWPELDSHSLGALAQTFNLGIKGEEGASDWSKWALDEEQLKYAANDTYITQELYKLIEEETKEMDVYKLDIETLYSTLVHQNRGLPIDHKEVLKYKRRLTSEIKKLNVPSDLNVNSSQQVVAYLNRRIGHTKVENSNGETLRLLSIEGDKEASQILEKRMKLKQLSYLEDLTDLKFAYSLSNPVGAKTGRFTSKGCDTMQGYFNLQQVPKPLQGVFKPTTGYIVYADYPALEIWMCAAILGDPFMVKCLKEGQDLHYAAAMQMTGKPLEHITPGERQLAKMCNFTLLYGAGYKKLAQAIIADPRFKGDERAQWAANAKQTREAWLRAYKVIASHQTRVFEHFNMFESMIVSTPMKRRVKATTPMEALNFPIQGGGAECTKHAIVELEKHRMPIINTVHDSICLLARTDKEAEEFKQALEYVMMKGYTDVIKDCVVSDLRLKVEAEIREDYKGE